MVYIFIVVGCKLLVISDNARNGKALKVFCLIVLLVMSAYFAYSRLSYSSTYNPEQAVFYNSAVLMSNDSLYTSSDMTTKLLNNPAQFGIFPF